MDMMPRILPRGPFSILLLLAVWGAADSLAIAAPITWESPQTVSGDGDVATRGTLVYAYNIGIAGVGSTTVNGVSFSALAFPFLSGQTVTSGNVTFTESIGNLAGYNNLGSLQSPYSGLSSAYRSLLDSGGSANVAATITTTLGGLTPGQEYLLQWWSSNAANSSGFEGAALKFTTAAATNSVQLNANTGSTPGGLGQYVIGTFTASGTSQQFTLDSPVFGSTNPLISGFQVRAVPEPATCVMALAGLVCGGVALRRRRQVRAAARRS